MQTVFIIQDESKALILACSEGHIEVVKVLLAHPTIDVNAQEKVRKNCNLSRDTHQLITLVQ